MSVLVCAAFFDGDFHELADAGGVERGERVLRIDVVLLVAVEEGAHVVTADAERGLGEVVRAEGEELGVFGDLIGGESATGTSIMVPTR